MKKFTLLFLIFLLSQTMFAQKPRPRLPKKNNLAASKVVKEEDALKAAVAQEDKAERINALRKFTADYPKSKDKVRVSEMLVSTIAALADEKMQASDYENGIAFFKLAVNDAPVPVSDKLFSEVLMQIPNSLFLRGQTAAAIEIAQKVEEKTVGNAKQTLALAGFYLGLENAAEAKRLVEKSLALEPNMPAAYQTLGLAERLNFRLDDSVAAYQKALELAPDSIVSKRSLAEMKRAVGKPSEAVALYREILAKNEADGAAQTGLILALFDEENRTEAESEMSKSLDANSNNLPLLVGAAYWYAAHNDGAKAVEFAEKAVSIEPRYTWAHIALARGLMTQKRPLEAEKTLLTARQYGNFPTLEYEIAAVRMQSGFYREAAEGLAKNFTVKDGLIETKLGGRVTGEAKNFIELLSAERKASIFEPTAADNAENADKLKSLLDFYQNVNANPNDETIAAKTDEFIKGDDKMKAHRQLFAAAVLLNKKSNLPKVLELTKAAVGGVENGLNVENPAAAILADELYESRQIANLRGEIVLVPEVPRQTLSNIVRGRIEDVSGWALFQSGKPADAAVRLKRAVSILPAKSSLWRDAEWRLGTALEADEKLKDALDAYIKSYTNGEPNAVKYSIVQSVYQRVNGNTDGLESKIGEKPASITAEIPARAEPPTTQTPEPTAVPETAVTEPTANKETPVSNTETVKTAEPKPVVETVAKTESNTENPVVVTKQYPPSPVVAAKIPEKDVPAEQSSTQTEPAPPTETENKSAETVTEEVKPAPAEIKAEPKEEQPKETAKTSESNQKSLFEPIIITVPKTEPKVLKKSSEDIGETRPRIAPVAETETISPCKILVNQENASILNDGGVLAIITELVGEGSVKDVKAVSSSPSDVEVVFDSEISGQGKRALFVVKSISQKKGIFTVSFETACGKKDVAVSVR